GVLSLIFWSLVVIVSIKYLTFVMRADNRGEGGILALMALAFPENKGNERRLSATLLALGVFGAALLYGDGMITPAISVLGAVEGLNVATPFFEPYVIPITLVILLVLFSFQRFGTGKVGGIFGPIMLIWFSVIGILGFWQIFQTPAILHSILPS